MVAGARSPRPLIALLNLSPDATALGRALDVPLPLANLAEQNLMEGINRGWGDKSAYTVTFQLQEDAAKVELRAAGIDPQKAAKYISTHPELK